MSAGDLEHLIVLPTLAVGVIIAVSRLLGALFRRWRQPQVVGELLAGLLLGPSFFGWLAPGASAALFPSEVLPFLKLLSDYGIVFFMFLIGLELDPALLRDRGRAATAVSTASIAVPLALGALLALALYDTLAPPGVPRSTFTVFFAVAMAITAFPVLARILIERDLLRSRVGAMTLTCAAANDLTAWCLLAAVLAWARKGESATGLVIGIVAYLAVMLVVVRPLGGRLEILYRNRGGLTQNLLAIVFLLLFASALAAHWVGIHLIFGAFLLGAVLPNNSGFVRDLSEKVEDFTTVLLLPIYFAYTGLRTDVRLLESGSSWILCGLIILVATAGKFAGSGLAARAAGLGWREAGALGALMNTRGLMELVILNVGLDLGIVGPAVFAMMVLMAIVTTLAATPALDAIYPAEQLRAEAFGAEAAAASDHPAVLVPVALSSSGPQLLDLAVALTPNGAPRVYALYVARPVERGALGANAPRPDPTQPQALAPLLARAAERAIDVHPLAVTSGNAADAICEVARLKGAGLILMGWHRPVFRRSVLSGTLEQVMRRSEADVAVFIDKGMRPVPRRLLLPYTGTSHDRCALRLAVNVARQMKADLTLLHVVRPGRTKPGLEVEARRLAESEAAEPLTGASTRVVVVESDEPVDAVIQAAAGCDLTIVGIGEEWHLTPGMLGVRQERIAAETPTSLLIVRGAAERGRGTRGEG